MLDKITFAKACITGVEHRVQNGQVGSRIKFMADFSADIAQKLDTRYLAYDRDSFPKEGFTKIELDFQIKHFALKLVVPKMEQHTLQMDSELLTKCVLMKSGGKKKGKATLKLQFIVMHTGSPFDLLTYLLAIGGADGVLEITPKQTEMFKEEIPKKRGRPAKVVEMPAVEAAPVEQPAEVIQ